ncbi:MAG: hypothetical protein LUQ11_03355 [Methylococcaceae bacterium]|nr:hypothetical protein [Methylococcaceae bacterium]
MKLPGLLVAVLMVYVSNPVSAGTLVNGNWAPAGCGVKPEAPVIDDKDVDAYNKSVAAINDWQQKARTYYECLIKEANADNSAIADTANREQAGYRESVEKVGAAVDAAKKKLDSK